MSSSETKMVRLRSSDGEELEVAAKAIGAASGMIKGMLGEEEEEDSVVCNVITLPKVTGPILSRVLEYVNRHFESGEYDDDADDPLLRRYDDLFVQVD